MRVLFILGSGGHTTRGLLLSKQNKEDSYFIIPWESKTTKAKVREKYFSVISPRFRAKDNRIMSGIRTIFLFLHSLIILFVVRPKIIISTGSGLTIPSFLIAGLLRIKTLYVESPSRIYRPSIAGSFLIGKVDMWLSSWSELANIYEKVEYRGMIV